MKKPTPWLWAGVTGGLLLTVGSVFRPERTVTILESEAASSPVIARVNGRPIHRSEIDRVVATLREKDPGFEMSDGMRREILDNLIGEELLLQRAVELGLADKDPVARRLLVRSMIESAAVVAEEEEPSEKVLRKYYSEHRALFQREGRIRVEQVLVRSDSGGDDERARERAVAAAHAWHGGMPWLEVAAKWGSRPISGVPEGLLPIEKLREYVGPTAARTASKLRAGDVSGPVKAMGGYHVLKLIEREPAFIPAYEEVREAVVRAYSEEVKSKRVEAYVKELRLRADVELLPDGRE